MPGFIPSIGTKGVGQLLAPFQVLLVANVPYTCIAIRQLADIIVSGNDPQALYYTPNGLSTDTYQADVAAGVSILTLQDASGSIVYVPSSYLTSYPDAGGVPYQVVMLGINLGPLPKTFNLSYLKSKIQDDVQDFIGIQSNVFQQVGSAEIIISNAQDASITAARQAAVGTLTTDYAKLLTATTQLQSAFQKIQMLEAYILGTPMAQLPPVCTVTNISPQNNGIMPSTGQTVTLQAQTTVGSVESLSYSTDGTTWNALTITPAQSISGTFSVTVPSGAQTISFKATDSNSVTSSIETVEVIVETVTIVNFTSSSTTLTAPTGVTTLLTVSGSGSTAGVASTGFGLSLPGGTPLPTTSYSNITVVPGTAYPLSIPTGGSITITHA